LTGESKEGEQKGKGRDKKIEGKGRGERKGGRGFLLRLGTLDPAVEEEGKGEEQGGKFGLGRPDTSFFYFKHCATTIEAAIISDSVNGHYNTSCCTRTRHS